MRWAIGLLAWLPMPAFALSCLPYGVTDAYLEADAASETYVPVLGTLQFDINAVPRVDWDKQNEVPALTTIVAVFDGHVLTQRGINQPLQVDVTLEVECFGPWCPSPKPGPVLAFLRKTDAEAYVVSTNACGGFLIGEPNSAHISAVKSCLAGRECRPMADH